MPIFARKTLRRDLAALHVRDLIFGTTSSSWGSFHILDITHADVTFSGEMLHARSWGRLFQSTNANGLDFRVATFNAGSGGFVAAQLKATTVPSGAEYEVHSALSPADKDRCLDLAIGRIRTRREVGIPSVEGLSHYTLEGAASPNLLLTDLILDVYYFADPSNSLSRDRRDFDIWHVIQTATGPELRVEPALAVSHQIVLDAVLVPSLGSGDNATVNIPDGEWVLYGAEAHAWNLLSKRVPKQEQDQYLLARRDAAREYSKRSALHQARISRPLPELDEDF